MSTLPPPLDPRPIVLVTDRAIGRADVLELCERMRALLEGGDAELVDCDVGRLVEPNAGTVDALARLQLTARRLGCCVRLRHAPPELQELLAFMGLGDVVSAASPLEPRRQAEEREQAGGVEEEADRTDPAGS